MKRVMLLCLISSSLWAMLDQEMRQYEPLPGSQPLPLLNNESKKRPRAFFRLPYCLKAGAIVTAGGLSTAGGIISLISSSSQLGFVLGLMATISGTVTISGGVVYGTRSCEGYLEKPSPSRKEEPLLSIVSRTSIGTFNNTLDV